MAGVARHDVDRADQSDEGERRDRQAERKAEALGAGAHGGALRQQPGFRGGNDVAEFSDAPHGDGPNAIADLGAGAVRVAPAGLRDPGVDERHALVDGAGERLDVFRLAWIVGDERLQARLGAGQLVRRLQVGLEIGGLFGEQIAALAGFGVFDEAEEVLVLFDHLVGVVHHPPGFGK